jgi:protocatechuate 3,4-dioxygenase beta subunit
MVLLSDVLGVSALVDSINSAAQAKSSRKSSGTSGTSTGHVATATESSILGPFHNDAAEQLENGRSIGSEGVVGEPMLIHGTVRSSTNNEPIEGATVDVWETNGNGLYDMQDPQRDGPDCRGIFRTDKQGRFYLLGVKSVDYNIPDEGPVGKLLKILDRNVTRPAHVVSFVLSCPLPHHHCFPRS